MVNRFVDKAFELELVETTNDKNDAKTRVKWEWETKMLYLCVADEVEEQDPSM